MIKLAQLTSGLQGIKLRFEGPVPIDSLALFRVLFGGLVFLSTVRFALNGWVERCYVQPTFFFKYWGFQWVEALPAEWMVFLHVVMAVAALGVCIGFLYRVAAPVFLVTFTYVELIDVTNYLNHYYLVSLLALLCSVLPLHRRYSVDAWLFPRVGGEVVPRWMLWLLRFQVGVVYFYAGLAKLEPDWLFHAQPLGIWLAARSELPIVGPFLAVPVTAYIFSWAGMLHDLSVVPFLLHRRTRPYAFGVVLVFHGFTHLLFNIGIFPFLMPICATLFFEPTWPRRFLSWLPRPKELPRRFEVSRWIAPAWVMWCAVQVLVPLRSHFYEGSVLWEEQGMRFSWRVMLREKNGSIRYRVRARGWPSERFVSPQRYLTSHQEREMSGQPDMILQLAHHIAEDFRAQGEQDVEVRADAWVSLNGRPAERLVDPTRDLARVSDGLLAADWILPQPSSSPLLVWRGP